MNVDLNKIITQEEFNKEWVSHNQFAISMHYRVTRPKVYKFPGDPDPTGSLDELVESYDYSIFTEEYILKYFRGLYNFDYIIGAFDMVGNGDDINLNDMYYADNDFDTKTIFDNDSLLDYVPLFEKDGQVVLVNCNVDSPKYGSVAIMINSGNYIGYGFYVLKDKLGDVIDEIKHHEELSAIEHVGWYRNLSSDIEI